MRKSKLMNQNMQLYSQLDEAAKTKGILESELKEAEEKLKIETQKNAELQAKLDYFTSHIKEDSLSKKAEDNSVTDEIQEIKIQEVKTFAPETVKPETAEPQPVKTIKETVLEDDLQYAADSIAKIVIESAKYSNKLAAGGKSEYIELVNLVLGKTEVSKADILAVTREEITLADKKQKIDGIKNGTLEYFESVMAQIN